MATCKCTCHNGSGIRHVIPCCSVSAKPVLRSVVESCVNEAIDSIGAEREKLIQKDFELKLASSAAPSSDKPSRLKEDDPMNTGAPKRATPTGVPDAQQQQQSAQQGEIPSVIDADAIIDKFNLIRSGKSFNDRDIRDGIKNFLAAMQPQQLKSLFSILQQMGQIVQPAVAPRVQAPAEEPDAMRDARLKMLQQKSNQVSPQPQLQPQTQPAVEKKPTPKAPDEEDLPPIRVGMKTTESIKRSMKSVIEN